MDAQPPAPPPFPFPARLPSLFLLSASFSSLSFVSALPPLPLLVLHPLRPADDESQDVQRLLGHGDCQSHSGLQALHAGM